MAATPRLLMGCWLRGIAEAAIIVGDCVLIAGRHIYRSARANLRLAAVTFAAQLQLEIIDFRQDLSVELFEQRRIAWEAAGIEALHFGFEPLHLAGDFRIALNILAQLIERVDGLLEGALRIVGGNGGIGRDRGTRRIRIISCIDVPVLIAATAPRVGIVALAVAIVDDTVPSADAVAVAIGFAGPELARAAILGRSSALTVTAVGIAILISGARAESAGERLHLVAQAFDIIERGLRSLIWRLFGAERLLRGTNPVREAAEIGGDLRFGIGIGSVSATQPIGAALQPGFEVRLIEIAESVTQFRGSGMLIIGHFAGGVAHLLLELCETIGQLLTILRELLRLAPEALFAFLGIALPGAALLENLAEAVRLPLLFIGELIGLTGHLAHAAGILLALQRAQSLGGLAEPVRGAAGIRGALLL